MRPIASVASSFQRHILGIFVLLSLMCGAAPASAQEQVMGQWRGLWLGAGPAYYMAPVGDPYTACKQSWDSFSGHSGLTMDNFAVGGRNSSGSVTTAYCSCSKGSCATGYWGTSGSASLTCPAGYVRGSDAPYYCVKARSVDAKTCKPPERPGTKKPSCSESAGSKQATVGDPIDTSTGALLHSIPVFATSDGLLRLDLNYNSRSEFSFDTGLDWVTNHHTRFEYAYSNLWLQTTDARVLNFRHIGGSWRGRAISGTLWSTGSDYRRDTDYFINNANGFYDYSDGTIYNYGSDWRILQVIKKGGYTLNYTYTGGKISQVADSLGRTIQFAYHANGLMSQATDPAGRVYKFEYTYSGGAVPNYANTADAAQHRAYLSKIIFPDDTAGTDTDNPRILLTYTIVGSSFMELTGMTDERGVQVAAWSFTDGRATAFSGPGGYAQTTLAFNDVANTTTVTNALGKSTVYKRSLVRGVGKLTEVDDVASAATPATDLTFNLDADGRVSREIEEEGQRVRYVRESRGLPTTIEQGETTADSRTTTIAWHANFPVPTQIVSPGLTSDFVVNSQGLVTSATYTDTTSHSTPYSTNGQTRTYTYAYLANSGGKLTSVDGPLAGSGDTVTYTYDASGNLATITNEVGHVTTITSVNGLGQPTSITDPNGVVTTLAYSPRGWVTSIVRNPGGLQRTTTFEYDLAGNVTKLILPTGGWIEYTYDDPGNVTKVKTSAGEEVVYTYDNLGNQLTEIRRLTGGATQFSHSQVYDDIGRLISDIGATSQTTQLAYDRANRVTGLTDPRSKVYGFGFDALNRLITSTDPDTDVESSTFNTANTLVGFEDGKGVSTSFVYNGFGEVIREVSPDRGTTDYWYDSAGRLIKKVDAESQEVLYTYDDNGRLLTESFTGAAGLNRSFTYDSTASGNKGVGQLTSTTDAKGGYTYYYNAFGELLTETRTTDGYSFGTSYEYDLNGEVTRVYYPSGREVQYVRNAIGDIASVNTQSAAGQPVTTVVQSVTRRPFGPLAGFTAGNGAITTYSHDGDYRLTEIDISNGGSTILDHSYVYDQSDNLLSITDNQSAGRSNAFTYTDDDRIETASGPYGSFAWTYDGNGNRLQEVRTIGGSATTDTYVYTAGTNRLAQIRDPLASPLRTLLYDDAGRVVDDDRTTAGAFEYAYDVSGRLTEVTSGATSLATYAYDAWDRRIAREVTSPSALTRYYVFDGNGRPIAESDGAGNIQREYIWLDEQLIGLSVGSGTSSSLFHIHTGHLGQPLRASSGAGAIVWDADFEPFGIAAALTATLNVDLRLPGQWEQFEAGLAQNWNRDYGAPIGRYLQPDPVGLAGGSNPYGYALQSPNSLVDADGLRFGPASGGALIGAVARRIAQATAVPLAAAALNKAGRAIQDDPCANTLPHKLAAGALLTTAVALEFWPSNGAKKALAELSQAAARAYKVVGPGRGAAYGTKIHAEFAKQLSKLNQKFTPEVSYKNGKQVPYGTKGSVRVDVVEGPLDSPTRVFDLKTGGARLTDDRIRQIQSHLPPGRGTIDVLEVR